MASFNRKRATYCAWCGEPMHNRAEGVLVRVRATDATGPGWSYHATHRGDCAKTFTDVMRSNGYTARYNEETR